MLAARVVVSAFAVLTAAWAGVSGASVGELPLMLACSADVVVVRAESWLGGSG
jgi:hypothetical protein